MLELKVNSELSVVKGLKLRFNSNPLPWVDATFLTNEFDNPCPGGNSTCANKSLVSL